MMFLALYCVFKNMERLSFDSPAETDIVKRPYIFLCPHEGERGRWKKVKDLLALVELQQALSQRSLTDFVLF